MLFSSWTSLLRIFVVGVPAYFALIALLRVSGKRTLSKYNAFDLIVTVAFGSTLASGLLSKDLAVSDVVGAFALLIGLQFVITWSSVRWSAVDRLVKSEPRLLLYRGRFLGDAMRKERVGRSELLAAIRGSGVSEVEAVHGVVLETDGTLSVITESGEGEADVLRRVGGYPPSSD